jgi:Protein of unknown function (DUF2624)
MKLFETMINHKISRIQPDELLSIASQYGVTLSHEQAVKITNQIAGRNINIFDASQRNMILQEISDITSPSTSKQIESIFDQLMANF